jgi:hypothetical protein
MRLRRNETIFGVIDHPSEGQEAGETVQVRGWVVSRVEQAVELEIRIDGALVEAAVNRTPRPDVLKVHARYARYNALPGYLAELNLYTLPPGRHEISVHATDKRGRSLIGRIAIDVHSEAADEPGVPLLYRRAAALAAESKRLLLVHIPKTAGTSLTAYLGAHFPRNRTLLHAENQVLGLSKAAAGRLDDYDLVSAHLKLDTLSKHLDVSRYYTVTVLREPAGQLNSHLAWVRRLADPKHHDELKHSPDYLKHTVERLEKLDLVEFIDTMGPDEKTLFDNCQFRYFLPQGTKEVDESQVPDGLARMAGVDLVGTTERLYDFLLVLAFTMGWEPPQRAPRLNTGRRAYFIDPEAAGEELQKRFRRLTRFDELVHRQAEIILETRFRAMVRVLADTGSGLAAGGALTPQTLVEAIDHFQTLQKRDR